MVDVDVWVSVYVVKVSAYSWWEEMGGQGISTTREERGGRCEECVWLVGGDGRSGNKHYKGGKREGECVDRRGGGGGREFVVGVDG